MENTAVRNKKQHIFERPSRKALGTPRGWPWEKGLSAWLALARVRPLIVFQDIMHVRELLTFRHG